MNSEEPQAHNWQELAIKGDYTAALQALDAARTKVVKSYAANIKASFPQRIGKLNTNNLEENISTVQIAFVPVYKGGGMEIRMLLQVPTVDVAQRAKNDTAAIEYIKDIITGTNRPTSELPIDYLVHEGFAAQIRRDTVFAARPQFMAYLSNGATITVEAMTDISIDKFKNLLDEIPLRSINAAITNAADP